jgi:hypothetical protein
LNDEKIICQPQLKLIKNARSRAGHFHLDRVLRRRGAGAKGRIGILDLRFVKKTGQFRLIKK